MSNSNSPITKPLTMSQNEWDSVLILHQLSRNLSEPLGTSLPIEWDNTSIDALGSKPLSDWSSTTFSRAADWDQQQGKSDLPQTIDDYNNDIALLASYVPHSDEENTVSSVTWFRQQDLFPLLSRLAQRESFHPPLSQLELSYAVDSPSESPLPPRARQEPFSTPTILSEPSHDATLTPPFSLPQWEPLGTLAGGSESHIVDLSVFPRAQWEPPNTLAAQPGPSQGSNSATEFSLPSRAESESDTIDLSSSPKAQCEPWSEFNIVDTCPPPSCLTQWEPSNTPPTQSEPSGVVESSLASSSPLGYLAQWNSFSTPHAGSDPPQTTSLNPSLFLGSAPTLPELSTFSTVDTPPGVTRCEPLSPVLGASASPTPAYSVWDNETDPSIPVFNPLSAFNSAESLHSRQLPPIAPLKSLARRRARSPVGKYPCNFEGCFKIFSRKHNLKTHMTIHDENRKYPYECDSCDRAFARRTDLERHYLCIHKRERNYGCWHCSRRFARKDTLSR
jgi:hypothetical protein